LSPLEPILSKISEITKRKNVFNLPRLRRG